MFGMQAPWELCLCLKVFTGEALSVLTSQVHVHCTRGDKATEIWLCLCLTIALETIARMKEELQKLPCIWMSCWLIFKIPSILYFRWSVYRGPCMTCKIANFVYTHMKLLFCSSLIFINCAPQIYPVRKQQLSLSGLATMTFHGLNSFEAL